MFHSLLKKIIVCCSLFFAFSLLNAFSKKSTTGNLSQKKDKVWVFVMAGQSNMAGRGVVEAEDTLTNDRIFTIDKNGKMILAKEPLHFYEPNLVGLDCGLSFAKTLLKSVPKDVSILILPTAVGGSSISQWLGDSVHRGVKLYSNFLEKIEFAKKNGEIKGVLWHQGESDTNPRDIPLYKERLGTLISRFREAAGNKKLPVLLGELGSYSANPTNWELINEEIRKYAKEDKYSSVISTKDFKDKGDHIHFNSAGQRELGKRFAEAWLKFN